MLTTTRSHCSETSHDIALTGRLLSELGAVSIPVGVDVDQNSASVSTAQQSLLDNTAQCAVELAS